MPCPVSDKVKNTENPKTLNSTSLNVLRQPLLFLQKEKGPKHTESSGLRQINQVKERVLTENALDKLAQKKLTGSHT